jgi:tRNA:m4X modification enzyme
LEHGPERVACAHCKTHVSALGLEKHVRRCPALAQAAARARAPYFVRDVNAGDASAASLAAEVASRPPRGDALRAFAARVRAACANEGVRPGMPFADPKDNERCRLATRARRDARRLAETRGGAVPPPLEPRHAAQHASIAAHMADAGLIRDGSDDEDEDARPTSAAEKTADAKTGNCQKRKPLYAELGAGRGYLSHFLLDAYGPLDLMLVEREPVRFKAERSMGAEADKRREAQTRDERRRARKEKETKDSDADEIDARAERDAETVRVRRAGAFVERLRIDIKDLDFSGVASARGRDVVFVAKHLCGAATDLALRCALADEITISSEKRESRKETEKNGGVRNGARALGACIATCCHHRCEWGSYVNRAFMEAHGFGAREFGWLARISSWAFDGAAGAHHGGDSKSTDIDSVTERRDEGATKRRLRRFRREKA